MVHPARLVAWLAVAPVFGGVWWHFEGSVPVDPEYRALVAPLTDEERAWLEDATARVEAYDAWEPVSHRPQDTGAALERLMEHAAPVRTPSPRACLPGPIEAPEEPRLGCILEWSPIPPPDPNAPPRAASLGLMALAPAVQFRATRPYREQAHLEAWLDVLLSTTNVEWLRQAARIAGALHSQGLLTDAEWNGHATRCAHGVRVYLLQVAQLDGDLDADPHPHGRWLNRLGDDLGAVRSWDDLERVLDETIRSTERGFAPPDADHGLYEVGAVLAGGVQWVGRPPGPP